MQYKIKIKSPSEKINKNKLNKQQSGHYQIISDVKRGQNLVAEARATRPRPRPRPIFGG